MIPEHLPPHAEPMVGARAAHLSLCIPMQWLNNKVQRRTRSVPHYRIGHVVRFRLSELEQWRDSHAAMVAPRFDQAAAAAPTPPSSPTPSDFDGVNWYRREGLAEIFVRRHGHEYRYCAPRRRWYYRTSEGWRCDSTFAVADLVRGICREAARRAGTPHARGRFGSTATASAVERIARLRVAPFPVDGEECSQ